MNIQTYDLEKQNRQSDITEPGPIQEAKRQVIAQPLAADQAGRMDYEILNGKK